MVKSSDRRRDKINSNLRKVVAEVIQREVRNPFIKSMITVLDAEISPDLHEAKIFVSLFNGEKNPQKSAEIDEASFAALQSATEFVQVKASKLAPMRFFPNLTFKLDRSREKQDAIDRIFNELESEQKLPPEVPPAP